MTETILQIESHVNLIKHVNHDCIDASLVNNLFIVVFGTVESADIQ